MQAAWQEVLPEGQPGAHDLVFGTETLVRNRFILVSEQGSDLS